jgi:hypothetical protein
VQKRNGGFGPPFFVKKAIACALRLVATQHVSAEPVMITLKGY